MIEISVKLTCDKCGLVMPNTGKTRFFMSKRLPTVRVINYDENWFLGSVKANGYKIKCFCPQCMPDSIKEQRQRRQLSSYGYRN